MFRSDYWQNVDAILLDFNLFHLNFLGSYCNIDIAIAI